MTNPVRPPFSENAYRVLALPGEATWIEIQRAAQQLRRLEAWGAWSSPWDLPLLGPVRRDKPDIDGALSRLEDPDSRLAERLLWFHERDAESAVAYLTASSIRDAVEGWSSSSLATARHDAAVVALVAALTFDPSMDDLGAWRRVLREWKAALASDDYWIEVMRVEMEGGFPASATLGDLRDLREAALAPVAGVLLERGRESDGGAGSRARAILREELPSAMFAALCGGEPATEAAPAKRPRPGTLPLQTAAPPRPAWPPLVEDPRDAPHARPPEPAEAPEEPAAPVPSRPARSAMKAHLARLRAGGPARPDAPAGDAPVERETSGKPEPAELEAVPPPKVAAPAPKEAAPPAPKEAVPPAPKEAVPPAPKEAAPEPPRRPRLRRRLLAGTVLAAGLAALALIAPWRREPAAPIAATVTGDPLRATLTARIDAADEAIARLLVDRAENRAERDFLRSSIADYRALVRDYDWRIAHGLPYDPAGYARVQGYLENDLAQYRAAAAGERSFADRYDALIRERARLVSQYNSRP